MKRKTLMLGALPALAIIVLSGIGHKVSAQSTTEPSAAVQTTVQVQPGDTLDHIARAFGTTYVRLFNANAAIVNPDVIYSGQTIRIPAPDEQLPDRMASAVPAPAADTSSATPAAQPRPQAQEASAKPTTADSVWDKLAQCESSGNWSINTGNGYYGGLQFTMDTWTAYGGTGSPANASREQQIAVAERVLAGQGWGAWPACSSKLGLR